MPNPESSPSGPTAPRIAETRDLVPDVRQAELDNQMRRLGMIATLPPSPQNGRMQENILRQGFEGWKESIWSSVESGAIGRHLDSILTSIDSLKDTGDQVLNVQATKLRKHAMECQSALKGDKKNFKPEKVFMPVREMLKFLEKTIALNPQSPQLQGLLVQCKGFVSAMNVPPEMLIEPLEYRVKTKDTLRLVVTAIGVAGALFNGFTNLFSKEKDFRLAGFYGALAVLTAGGGELFKSQSQKVTEQLGVFIAPGSKFVERFIEKFHIQGPEWEDAVKMMIGKKASSLQSELKKIEKLQGEKKEEALNKFFEKLDVSPKVKNVLKDMYTDKSQAPNELSNFLGFLSNADAKGPVAEVLPQMIGKNAINQRMFSQLAGAPPPQLAPQPPPQAPTV